MKQMSAEIVPNKAKTPLVQAQHRLRIVCALVLAVSVAVGIYLCISVGYISGGMWGVLKTRLMGKPLLDSEGWLYYSGGGLEAFARDIVLVRADLFLVSLLWALPALWGTLSRGEQRQEKVGILLCVIAFVLILLLTMHHGRLSLFAPVVCLVLSLPVLVQIIFLAICIRRHRIE